MSAVTLPPGHSVEVQGGWSSGLPPSQFPDGLQPRALGHWSCLGLSLPACPSGKGRSKSAPEACAVEACAKGGSLGELPLVGRVTEPPSGPPWRGPIVPSWFPLLVPF